jgi:hypothetical protein
MKRSLPGQKSQSISYSTAGLAQLTKEKRKTIFLIKKEKERD